MRKPATIRRSVMTVALVTAFVALLINAITLIALDISEYREARRGEARTQAEMLIRVAAAAIDFNDPKEANNLLNLLKEDPNVLSAGVYPLKGKLFASYSRAGQSQPPPVTGAPGFRFEGNHISGFYTVIGKDGAGGTVYLSIYYGLYERLYRYLGILVVVMAGAFGIAVILSNALQRAVTRPIQAVTEAARRVVEGHDYSVRADPQPGYETGLLAEAFNRMLAEIGKRTEEIKREMHEREEAKEALREADRKKDRFLATLAHELRNPLAPITSAVQVMKLDAASQADHRLARDVIDRQVRQMSRLLDDLLDVGRITNDKLELRKQRVQLSSILDSAIESSRPLIEQAGHALEIAVPLDPIELEADPIRIAQVVSNLLNNAAKYTAPGGNITLSAQPMDGQVEVTVQDNGIGMTQEEAAHLFDIFAQSASASHLSKGGLGIGLFLVKSLTTMHGGTVEVHSAGPGLGSRFVVRLPTATETSMAVPHRAQASVPAERCRILVVDDNRDAAAALATMLRINGYEIRICHEGCEALRMAEAFRPDVAFADIGLPDLNGYELARSLRAAAWGKGLLLVAITGWGQAGDRRTALEAGFDHHLTKPARAEDIEAILRSFRSAEAA